MARGLVERWFGDALWIDEISDTVQPWIEEVLEGGKAAKDLRDLMTGGWLGHPLHPVLTDVPIGAWTLGALLDLVSTARGDDATLDTASDWALGTGIAASLATAATGLSDWSEIGGIQRRLGFVHGLLNIAALGFNTGSLALRLNGGNRGAARALSAVGYLIVTASAYIGDELVYQTGQAVNRQAWVEAPEKYTDVAAVADLEDGQMHRYDVENSPVVLVRLDDGIHAFNGVCPHFGGPLWEGTLEDHCLTCPWHGSQFDVGNGSLVTGPSAYPILCYDVRERDGRVQVRLEGY